MIRRCLHCGEEIIGRAKTARYCSVRCASRQKDAVDTRREEERKMKINQGNKHHTFQCKRCVAVFRKQQYLDIHMEVVHRVILDETPPKSIRNNKKTKLK